MNNDSKRYVSKPVVMKPAFEENNIPIALAANNYFIPYTATLLQSIIDNASNENNYDILVLTQDIKGDSKKRIQSMLAAHPNFSVRYADPSYLMEGYNFCVKDHFSLQTYYRLVLPELIPEYDKIIYLDSDMIVMTDIAELYYTDVEGYLVAACLDPDTAGLYNGYAKDKKSFMNNVMKLENPYSYFQAGTLVLNLKEFRKTYTMKYVLDFAVSEMWQLLDQDILNCLCKNKVKYVDMSWNVMVDYGGFRIKDIIGRAPQWMYKMYMEARKHPKMIHYAGPEKPWSSPEMDMGDVFWSYARKTGFYEVMLYRMSCSVVKEYAGKPTKPRQFILKLKKNLLPYGTRRYAVLKRVKQMIFLGDKANE